MKERQGGGEGEGEKGWGGRGGARDPCYLKEVVFKLLSSAAALRLRAFRPSGPSPAHSLSDSYDSLRLLSDSVIVIQ